MHSKILAKLGQSDSGQPPETKWQIIHILRTGLGRDDALFTGHEQIKFYKLKRCQSFKINSSLICIDDQNDALV